MRLTADDIRGMKGKEKIVMLTAYDFVTARLVDEAGVHMILVGDSLGMVVLGYESTIPVTMEDMLHHTRAVVRGARRALIVGDMPFMTYHLSDEQALMNAGRFIQEGGAQAVKLEGGEVVAERVRRIVSCGIPVMGHIGLMPQYIHAIGGYKVIGKTKEMARRLVMDAKALEEAGVFSIVLELVPSPLSDLITRKVSIPTIGIGSGPGCDGQVQVISDILGLYTEFVPRHAKQYLVLRDLIREAILKYMEEVRGGKFPTEKETYKVSEEMISELEREL